MNPIKIYQVDAFADDLFLGNPAAVCILDNWIDEELMQKIGAENNLSETAFVVPVNDYYSIRWFTPESEVELCGHATLATAYVIFRFYNPSSKILKFKTKYLGWLEVTKDGEYYYLDMPTDIIEPVEMPKDIIKAVGKIPLKSYRGHTDYLLVYENERIIRNINPDFAALKKLKSRGVIVTAPGINVDFVSRFFAPGVGINEDPVTGSAHSTLTPYWSQKLGRNKMMAKQISKRGGKIVCINKGKRALAGGRAKLFMKGEIYIN